MNSPGFPFPESDGTQQLLHLMPVLSAADQNKVVVIDELDRSLHPLICWEFIRFFSETRPGDRKQLIVTTHEVHLLNQELLRRDSTGSWRKTRRSKAGWSRCPTSTSATIERGEGLHARSVWHDPGHWSDGRFGTVIGFPYFGDDRCPPRNARLTAIAVYS